MGGLPQSAAAQAIAERAQQRAIRFVMVWTGTRYGAEYPAILKDMVDRNSTLLSGEVSWWAITDRPDELPAGVNAIPADPRFAGWWTKCQLFDPAMPWNVGDRCVYFDLDSVIVGRLEDLVETPGIIKDWNWPGYNSSVMVWDHGQRPEIWTKLTQAIIERAPGPIVPAELLASGMHNGGDQEHITECAMKGEPWPILRPDWCVHYRLHAEGWPTDGAKVVCFPGSPKPHEVTDGWVPNVWKVGGFTSLPVMDGMNVSTEAAFQNVRANVLRDLPWFSGYPGSTPRKDAAILVCGSPSMRGRIQQIKDHKRRGGRIVSVNNAWRFLVENGVTPDTHIMVDARPENAEFVKDAPASTRYLIASQCHPDVFEALKDREVVVWHNGMGENEELREILQPWWDEGPDQRPIVLVPGGGTVGLRALWLCAFSGFRTIHVYGMDSSLTDGEHHAYAQPMNDGETVIEVVMGERTYRASLWMVRQSHEFRWHWRDLKREGVTIHVHGVGLIPDIAKQLRAGAA